MFLLMNKGKEEVKGGTALTQPIASKRYPPIMGSAVRTCLCLPDLHIQDRRMLSSIYLYNHLDVPCALQSQQVGLK